MMGEVKERMLADTSANANDREKPSSPLRKLISGHVYKSSLQPNLVYSR